MDELILRCERRPSKEYTTLSVLRRVDTGAHVCWILEDPIREIPGRPVATWKQHGCTAIPAGRFQVTLEQSERFGPDTITLRQVPGFSYIRVHGGNTHEDTMGCPLTGDVVLQAERADRIAAGTSQPALRRVKALIKEHLQPGRRVWWEVVNPITTR